MTSHIAVSHDNTKAQPLIEISFATISVRRFRNHLNDERKKLLRFCLGDNEIIMSASFFLWGTTTNKMGQSEMEP